MSFGDARKLSITASIVLLAGLITPISANAIDDPCLSSTAIIGTPGDDVITGTPSDDIICTLAGRDSIEGLAGDDIIIAGDGDDRIVAMEGNDYIEAGEGDDFVDAGPGDDKLLGNPGDDILWGGLGIDELLGLAGNDTLDGGIGADLVDGGIDRNYCVKDPKDQKALSCFYDTKAPALKTISVSATSRSIDTSETAQWVRVKALITEAGSGITDVGFFFAKDFGASLFGASGSLKYPDRQPTSCSSLNNLSQTPPPNTTNPKSHWCIEQQSSSAVVVEFLIAAPYRLPKGTYKFTSMILTDGALNRSSQNGLWFKASINQTASVPSGIPVLKSFEFISENKVNTAESAAKIAAEVAISTGPVGLGSTQIKFIRDVDRRSGDNGLDLVYNPDSSPVGCDLKIAKTAQKSTCVLSDEGGVVKLLLVSTLPKNSPAGTYKFSFLGLAGKSSSGTELSLEDLRKDSRYEKFTKLAIVQAGASVPFKPNGSVDLIGITTTQKNIDTGSGPASLNVQISIVRNGAAANWTLNGHLVAMHCKSGNVRKFNNYKSPLQYGITIQAGEYCSELRDEGSGKKWWPDSMASNTIAMGEFRILPGSNSSSTTLTIPSNFRKGMILVGLGQIYSDIGAPNYISRVGNWSSRQAGYNTNPYPGTINCGIYPSCTQHYSVLQNG